MQKKQRCAMQKIPHTGLEPGTSQLRSIETRCASQSTANSLVSFNHPLPYLLGADKEKLPLINDSLVLEILS
jgi:hypothetical protein